MNDGHEQNKDLINNYVICLININKSHSVMVKVQLTLDFREQNATSSEQRNIFYSKRRTYHLPTTIVSFNIALFNYMQTKYKQVTICPSNSVRHTSVQSPSTHTLVLNSFLQIQVVYTLNICIDHSAQA